MTQYVEIKDAGGVTVKVDMDEIAGVLHQYTKVKFGADGVGTPVSAVNPLPVTSSAPATGMPIEVSGAQVSAANPLPAKILVDGADVADATNPMPSKLKVGLVDVDNTNRVPTGDLGLDIARGLVTGMSIGVKFGYNDAITTVSAPEDIWRSGGLYTGQPIHSAAAETVTAVSSSALDTAAGTGAQSIMIEGLDGSFNQASETIPLNGTTAATSVGTYKRVFRVWVVTAGTTGANQGTITIAHSTTTANVFAVMQAGDNQSLICALTVPAGKTMYVRSITKQITRTTGAAGAADIEFFSREEGGVYRARRRETIGTSSPSREKMEGGLVLPEKTDVVLRVLSVSDNTTTVSARFEYVLIDN